MNYYVSLPLLLVGLCKLLLYLSDRLSTNFFYLNVQQVIHQVCLLCHGLLLTQKLISGFMLCLTLFRLLRPHFDLLYLLGPNDPRLDLLVLFGLIACLNIGD